MCPQQHPLNSVGWSKFRRAARRHTLIWEQENFLSQGCARIVRLCKEALLISSPKLTCRVTVAPFALLSGAFLQRGAQRFSNRWACMDIPSAAAERRRYLPLCGGFHYELTELFRMNISIGGDEVPRVSGALPRHAKQQLRRLASQKPKIPCRAFQQHHSRLFEKRKSQTDWLATVLEASAPFDETSRPAGVRPTTRQTSFAVAQQGNKIVLSPNPYLYMDHLYC